MRHAVVEARHHLRTQKRACRPAHHARKLSPSPIHAHLCAMRAQSSMQCRQTARTPPHLRVEGVLRVCVTGSGLLLGLQHLDARGGGLRVGRVLRFDWVSPAAAALPPSWGARGRPRQEGPGPSPSGGAPAKGAARGPTAALRTKQQRGPRRALAASARAARGALGPRATGASSP
jgi:hypothetical protein